MKHRVTCGYAKWLVAVLVCYFFLFLFHSVSERENPFSFSFFLLFRNNYCYWITCDCEKMSFTFGSFKSLCSQVAMPLCPLVEGKTEPLCYSRNIDLGGMMIFEPGNHFFSFVVDQRDEALKNSSFLLNF